MQECTRVLEPCSRREKSGNAVREKCEKPGGYGLWEFVFLALARVSTRRRRDLHGISWTCMVAQRVSLWLIYVPVSPLASC